MSYEISMSYQITPLEKADLAELKHFTDAAIGKGYYSESELENIFERSQAKDSNGKSHMCSFLLKEAGHIVGVRFTYPPGMWVHGKGSGLNKGLTQKLWPHPQEQTGYFQSLFLADSVRGSGWGSKLSGRAIEELKSLGATGVVCHSWKESPDNSSSRYLEKMGFKAIAEHALYWKDIDYNCTRCGKPPCQCTAIEMYLRLDGL